MTISLFKEWICLNTDGRREETYYLSISIGVKRKLWKSSTHKQIDRDTY